MYSHHRRTAARRRLIGAALAATALVLVSCAGPVEPEATGPVTAPKGTLSLMAWGSEEDHASIQSIAEAYEKAFPDVKITFKTGDCAIDVAACKTLIAANNMPDIVVSHNAPLTTEAKQGVLENLDPLIERDGVSLDQFVPASVEGVVSAHDGGHYGLPMGYHIEAMYYNKAMFDKAGLAYPDASGDYSYADLREWAIALTLDDEGKTPADPGFDPENIVQSGLYLPLSASGYDPVLLANGASMVDLDDPTTCTVETPEAISSFQYIQDLMYKDHAAVSPASDQALAGKYQFAQGRVAMLFGAHWMTKILQDENSTLAYDVAALPRGTAGNASIVNVHSWALSKQSRNTELAWHFLKWATGEGAAPAMGLIPANTDAIGPIFLDAPDEPASLQQAFIDPASWELTMASPEFGSENWIQASGQDGLAPALEKIFQNIAPADEALEGICAVIDPILAQ